MAQVNGFIIKDIRHNIDDRLTDIINIAQSIYLDIDFGENRLNTNDEILFRSRVVTCFEKLRTYGIANSEAEVFVYLPEKEFLLTTTAADDMRYIYGTLKHEKKMEASQEEWKEQIISAPVNTVLMAKNMSYRNYGKNSLTYVLRSSIGQKDKEVKDFFRELCEGFLNVIDEEGMLHQVLDEQDSYGEASCSAMCAAAFARGVKLGILPGKPYADAAKRMIEALKKFCIDKEGNVYGVCVGSNYSFRREYYKNELGWRINDTHGTGIVLLAMVETAGV